VSTNHGSVPPNRLISPPRGRLGTSIPPEGYFIVSAVFHYLGPSFAVLLFARVDVLGVAWFRIVSAATVFALWRRPWSAFAAYDTATRRSVVAWGVVLAVMNCTFYLAIARLPLASVAAIEFLPVIVLAAVGSRTSRNIFALALAVSGVYRLTGVLLPGDPMGVVFAFANATLFAAYITLGHRLAQRGAGPGIDSLAAAMVLSALAVTPFTIWSAIPAFSSATTVLAGVGVGICSSVVPYIADQLAMARIKRSTYALLVSLLPATATIVGLIVLGQVPTTSEAIGVGLVIAAVGIHRDEDAL